ncbi:MAG TPA: glycosyltransferase [Acidimicrobiales bacterium]|nr:glycosyltransferase [Acidimicrobiales bacterium]
MTVVVATRDRPAMLRGTLEALSKALGPGDELVVVDSASTDKVVGAIAAESGARFVRCELPGTCRARNAGARAASAQVIAFTDDDCLPDPGWVAAVAAAFANRPELGFLTGRVLPIADGGDPRLNTSVVDDDAARLFVAGDDPVVAGHGANMAWRRAALDRIGGFDEALGPGSPLRAAEDHDAFWRALRAGLIGRFEPAAVVRHRQWRTWRKQLAAYFGYGIGSGAVAVKRWRLGTGADRADAGGRPSLLRDASGRRVVKDIVWDRGATVVGRRLAEGYELGALAEATALVGAIVGAGRATRLDVVDGHFTPPRKWTGRRMTH